MGKGIDMREKAIARLIEDWRSLISDGWLPEDVNGSLREQVEQNVQGWDSSMEDLEADPSLGDIMGYDIDDMTDEQVDEWCDIVTEAARRYLEEQK